VLAAPQAIPPLPVILPLPLGLTVSVAFPELPPVNEAVTVCELFIVTLQVVGVPVHAPPQPENVAPVLGVSVSVITVPGLYDSEQSVLPAPQSIPLPVTSPLPVGLTVRVGFPAPRPVVKVAVTALAELIVTVQVVFVSEAVQSPPQPVKVAPASETAVSVTEVPSA
jgi:hypothetical protein